jgi:uncharacterized integral membrane protein
LTFVEPCIVIFLTFVEPCIVIFLTFVVPCIVIFFYSKPKLLKMKMGNGKLGRNEN